MKQRHCRKAMKGHLLALWRMEASIKRRPEMAIPKRSKISKGGINEQNSKRNL